MPLILVDLVGLLCGTLTLALRGSPLRPILQLEASLRNRCAGLLCRAIRRSCLRGETDTLGWLVSAAYGYHNLRRANASRVRIMGGLLTALGVLMVLQTLFWLIALR